MTVIAYDGRRLAADKQNTVHGFSDRVTKIFRVPGGMVGFAGHAVHIARLVEWFKAGRPADAWPAPTSEDKCGDALFIDGDGRIFLYSGESPIPMVSESPFAAMGSGRDYALAALYLGHSASDAVRVASALDIHCGQGVDVLELGVRP